VGGNRKGSIRSMLNLVVTMFLGGLWYGASWTFVVWGGLHGVGLIINHGFRSFRRSLGHDLAKTNIIWRGVSWALTFLFVAMAWVIFRAESINGAQSMFRAMLGLNGLHLPEFIDHQFIAILILLLFFVCFMPSTQEFLREYKPALDMYGEQVATKGGPWIFQYKPGSFVHILLITFMAMLSMFAVLSDQPTEFLYYDF
jgi:alginate O-acetyltransferase complex protein AlgI